MRTLIDPENAAWIRLVLIPGLGPAVFFRLLQTFQSPLAVLKAPSNQVGEILKPALLKSFLASRDEPLPDVYEEWLSQENNHLITLADSFYPAALLQDASPPPVLFAKGSLEMLQRPMLAIVGSRHATQPGVRHAEQFASYLSQQGIAVVSGMAAGIDAAAHRGALRGSGSTIAVVGTGLDRVYPASNRDLAHEIAEKGLILSEFPLGTPPLSPNFPRRNRIISGLSLGCLVVEAALQSGSLITARVAAEQGREVFAIPGSIDAPQSKGCHQLIKQGAKLVETANDILEELRFSAPLLTGLSAESTGQNLPVWFSQLGFDPFDADQACELSGLTAGEVCAILFELEMASRVTTLPGGRYQRLA